MLKRMLESFFAPNITQTFFQNMLHLNLISRNRNKTLASKLHSLYNKTLINNLKI